MSSSKVSSESPLVLGSHSLRSRLIVGTGKYATFELMRECLEVSGSDVITVRTACTSNVALFAGGVSGYVDVAAVKGDQITRMIIRNAAAAAGSAQVQVDRAFIGMSNESTG